MLRDEIEKSDVFQVRSQTTAYSKEFRMYKFNFYLY